MKKFFMLATAALLISGVTFSIDNGKKKSNTKKSCSKKGSCTKDKDKTAKI